MINHVKILLNESGVDLHRLSGKEMYSVICHPAIAAFQVFHGDRELFEMFQDKTEAA